MRGKKLSEKDYYGDIIGLSETQEIISLEMYNSKFGSREYNKSYSYACRLYNGQLDIIGNNQRKSYGEYKTVYSINFMNGNYLRNSEELINVYTMKNLKTNKIGKEKIKVILIRLDKLKSIEYNKDKSLVISIIRLINSEN